MKPFNYSNHKFLYSFKLEHKTRLEGDKKSDREVGEEIERYIETSKK